MRSTFIAATAAFAITAAVSAGGVRQVQITEVDTANAVVTVTNLGSTPQPLDGWRFCSADNDEQLRYSLAGGLNGRTLAPGEQLFVHWNNDAPADPSRINISSLGGFSAQPMGNGPFGLAFYFTTPFGNGNNIADYVQWTDSASNAGNAVADARADEAFDGGLWSGVSDFVITLPGTTTITLNDLSGAAAHSPSDYDVDGDPGNPCPGDIDNSGDVGFNDLVTLLAEWGACPGCGADLDGDDDVDFDDLVSLLALWGPCP